MLILVLVIHKTNVGCKVKVFSDCMIGKSLDLVSPISDEMCRICSYFIALYVLEILMFDVHEHLLECVVRAISIIIRHFV